MLQISDLIGKPFKKGSYGPNSYDCWGLSVEVFKRCGVNLPDYRVDCETDKIINNQRPQWVRCVGEIPIPALIVFTTHGICDHLGVYLGNGKFIHAHETAGVVIARTDHIFWKKRIEGFYKPGWLKGDEKE